MGRYICACAHAHPFSMSQEWLDALRGVLVTDKGPSTRFAVTGAVHMYVRSHMHTLFRQHSSSLSLLIAHKGVLLVSYLVSSPLLIYRLFPCWCIYRFLRYVFVIHNIIFFSTDCFYTMLLMWNQIVYFGLWLTWTSWKINTFDVNEIFA